MMKSGEMLMPLITLLQTVLTDKQLDRTRVVSTYRDVVVTWCFAHNDAKAMNLKIRGALKEFVKTQGRTLRIRFEQESLY